MSIGIKKLTPDMAEDYVRFFEETPHNEKWHSKCYCVWVRLLTSLRYKCYPVSIEDGAFAVQK